MQQNKKSLKEEHAIDKISLEASASLFASKMNQELPKLRYSYMYSQLDVTTKKGWTWDIWFKFPFRVKVEEADKFRLDVEKLFQDRFCH